MILVDFNPFRTDLEQRAPGRRTSQLLELIPWESGKTWLTKEEIRVVWRGHTLTVPKAFRHDRYTFAPNPADALPCIVHDYACQMKKWDDGTHLDRATANEMFRDLMRASPDAHTRRLAGPYYFGVEVHRIWRKIFGRD